MAGAPRGARLLGALPLPGTPAEARLGVAAAGARPAAADAPSGPPRGGPYADGDDAATTRLDMADLARMRQVPADGAGRPAEADGNGASGAPAGQGQAAQAPAGAPPGRPAGGPPPAGAPGGPPGGAPPPPPPASQPEEETVDDTALQAVAGLDDEVLVIDEEPLFHLGRCSYLYGREVIPLPASEAVELGFTGCSWCTPVAALTGPRSADSRR
ncbi:MAG TPA: hypothetical protein VNP37_14170 [Actinomycetospora sp.]|nr:hypothetical protein [Actinomycetospora sp.]